MKETIAFLLFVVGVIATVLFFIYTEIGIWQECRTTNSFFYCMRVLSR